MSESRRRVLPTTLKVAIGLLWVQGLGLVGLGAVLGTAALTGHPTSRGAGATEAVVAVVLGLLFGFLGYALARGHRAARTPAVVLELMLLAVGYFMIKAGVLWAGAAAIVLALLVGALLIAPATRESLDIN